jgi:hypothetical protein
MMNSKLRNLLVTSAFAVAVTLSGTAVTGLAAVELPQAAGEQTGDSTDNNTDQAAVSNHDDGEVDESGVEQAGESINDNTDQATAGNHDDAQQGQTGDN